MKKNIIIIILLALSLNIWAEFEFFPNPARLATDQKTELRVPILNMGLNIKNSLLNMNTLDILDTSKYEDGGLMSEADKKKLTADDLTFSANFETEFIGIHYKNWDFSSRLISFADINILDKQFAEIIFYGNEIDQVYNTNAADNSVAYGFLRNSFQYGYPRELHLGMIHSTVDEYLAKSTWGKFIDAMPIYVGFQINFDYSIAMLEVLESEQEFGAMSDYTYYDYYLKAKYTDGDSKRKLDINYGLGAEVNILENLDLHFSLNDIFAKLEYENLAGRFYDGTFIDSLDYLNEEYEAFDQSTQSDSVRYSSHELDIKTSVVLGLDYSPINRLQLQVKYDGRRYSLGSGFSIAARYKVAEFFPIKLVIGSHDEAFFTEIQTGLNFARFDFDIAFSNNSGLFKSAKGIGLRTGMKIRF